MKIDIFTLTARAMYDRMKEHDIFKKKNERDMPSNGVYSLHCLKGGGAVGDGGIRIPQSAMLRTPKARKLASGNPSADSPF